MGDEPLVMAEIGILHGTLESFPQAVLEKLNGHRRGCCRFLTVDALDLEQSVESGWDTKVVLDLFSRKLPFLNESLYLIWQFSETKVLNEPRTLRLHNRATVRQIAKLAGFKTARSILLPAKETFPKISQQGYVNLRYPLSWDRILEACGPYPILQTLALNGEPGGLITDLHTLWRRYDQTGSALQELVSPPASQRIFRLFFVGDVIIVREMDPLTRQLYPSSGPGKTVLEPLIQAAKRLRKEIPLSISAFDLGWDGQEVEYIDLNPDPSLEWWQLGERDFSRLVNGAVSLLKSYLPPARAAGKRTTTTSSTKKGK